MSFTHTIRGTKLYDVFIQLRNITLFENNFHYMIIRMTDIGSVPILKADLALKIGKPATSTVTARITVTTSRISIRKGAATITTAKRASRATKITVFISVWLCITLGVVQQGRTDQLSISTVSCEPSFMTREELRFLQ